MTAIFLQLPSKILSTISTSLQSHVINSPQWKFNQIVFVFGEISMYSFFCKRESLFCRVSTNICESSILRLFFTHEAPFRVFFRTVWYLLMKFASIFFVLFWPSLHLNIFHVVSCSTGTFFGLPWCMCQNFLRSNFVHMFLVLLFFGI